MYLSKLLLLLILINLVYNYFFWKKLFNYLVVFLRIKYPVLCLPSDVHVADIFWSLIGSIPLVVL